MANKCGFPAMCCGILLSLAVPGTRGAEPAAHDNAKEIARFCWEGFVAGREQVRSAKVRITENSKSLDKEMPQHKMFLAFDTAIGRQIFENVYQGRTVRRLRLPDREILFIAPPGRSVAVYNVGAAPEVDGSLPIELRLMGIETTAEFDYPLPLDKRPKLLTIDNVQDAVQQRDGKYRVTWKYPLQPAGFFAEQSIWFDKEFAFAPVRMEAVILPAKAKPDAAKPDPVETVVTQWKHEGGVSVPIKCQLRRRQPKQEIEVELTWENINQDLPAVLFQLESIVSDKTIMVHDLREATPKAIPFRQFDKPMGWVPRVPKLHQRGKVTTLAAVTADVPQGATAANAFAGSKAGEPREVAGIKLCWCPAGQFTFGSPGTEPERRPGESQVAVKLSKGFWMGKYEVTQGDWKRVAGTLPGALTLELPEGDDLPVGNVNFAEAEAFCGKLTAAGRQAGQLPAGWEFRLPTEAQWEYACRAGTTTATSFGDSIGSRQANILGDKPYNGGEPGPSLGKAAKVGSYPANPWGLHDMHGNSCEWCRDWFHMLYPGGVDPDLHDAQATATRNRDGTIPRSRRGSCWADPGWPSRSAFRQRFEPARRYDHIGFRIVAVEP